MELEKKVYMLSTETCSKCPLVKERLAGLGLDVEYIDNELDPSLAAQFGIMAVPTIIDARGEDIPKLYIGQDRCLHFISLQINS